MNRRTQEYGKYPCFFSEGKKTHGGSCVIERYSRTSGSTLGYGLVPMPCAMLPLFSNCPTASSFALSYLLLTPDCPR
eukprot:6466807-Amphidinium_carterae.3